MNKTERNKQIAQSTATVDALVEQFGVSRSTVYRVKREAELAQAPTPEQYAEPSAMSGNRRALFGQTMKSGVEYHGGQVTEEFQRELQDDGGVKLYTEMATHPVVAAVLFAIEMAQRQVNWYIEPGGEDKADEDAATYVDECINDMSQTWDDVVAQVFSMLTYGFAVCELVYKKRLGQKPQGYTKDAGRSRFDDGRIGWRRWQFISPKSMPAGNRWSFDEWGRVQEIHQQAAPDYVMRSLPIEKALMFRVSTKYDNPEPPPILRYMYRPWYYATELAEVEAIGAERLGVGLPVIYLGDGTRIDGNSSDYDEALDLVRNVRADSQMGVVVPYPKLGSAGEGRGVLLELLSPPSRGLVNFNEVIERYEKRMAMTVLAQFIFIGMMQVGTQALNQSATDTFQMSISAWSDMVADVVNRFAIPRLLALNPFKLETLPQLAHSEIGVPDLKGISEFVNNLVNAQVLTVDDELERYLRELANFPDKPEATIEITEQGEEETAPQDEEGPPEPEGEEGLTPEDQGPEGEPGGGELVEVEGEEAAEPFALETIAGALARDSETGEWARGGGAPLSKDELAKADALAFGKMSAVQAREFAKAGLMTGRGGKYKYTQKGKELARDLRSRPHQGVKKMKSLGLVTARKKGPSVKLAKKGGKGGKGKKITNKQMADALVGGGMRKDVAQAYLKLMNMENPNWGTGELKKEVRDDLKNRGILKDAGDGKVQVSDAGRKFFAGLKTGNWDAAHKEMRKQTGTPEPSADLIDEDFALRLKRGGPKWERSTNAYELELRRTYAQWADATSKELAAMDDDEDYQTTLRERVDELVFLLLLLGRRNLPTAHALGLADYPATPEGYQELAAALAENERYLAESLGPDIVAKVERRIGEEPLIREDQAAMGGLLGTFLSRTGLYAGAYWNLIHHGLVDRLRQKDKPPKVRAVLDPSAAHCRQCPEYAGEYESIDALLARTSGYPGGWASDCGSNCRCWLEFEQKPGVWVRS